MSRHRTTVRTPVVTFARRNAPAEAAGDMVRRKGVIFRAGVFPEKRYAMTPEELRAVVADFKAVPIDLGHPSSASPLDGAFGHLETVELSDDGTTLYGTAAFPKWFDDLLGDARRKVSASWDRATKRLRSLSLVTHPHIEEAELQAAFACACGHEAETDTTTTKGKGQPMSKREEDIAALQAMSDEEYEAAVPDGDFDDTDDTDDTATDEGASDFSDDLDPRDLRIAELEEKDRRREAKAFAAQMKAEKRITSDGQVALAEAAMFAALTDDAILPRTVNFSQGGKAVSGTREQMVRADYASRAPHQWDRELVPGGAANFGRVLPSGAEGPETDEQYAARVNSKVFKRDRIGSNGAA